MVMNTDELSQVLLRMNLAECLHFVARGQFVLHSGKNASSKVLLISAISTSHSTDNSHLNTLREKETF